MAYASESARWNTQRESLHRGPPVRIQSHYALSQSNVTADFAFQIGKLWCGQDGMGGASIYAATELLDQVRRCNARKRPPAFARTGWDCTPQPV